LVSAVDLDAIRDALPIHAELTRAEPGCLVFRVDEDPNQIGKFDVYEEFDSQESFQKHQERVRESDWGTISKNAERFYSFDEVD
jgi:quinol monooxygenase YgiN